MIRLMPSIATIWLLAALAAPATLAEGLELTRGQRLLVMQSRDLIIGGDLMQGSGDAVFQAVHNTLTRQGLTPIPSSYGATVNALEEGRLKECVYVVRPNLERFSTEKAFKQQVRLSIEFIESASGEVAASCTQDEIGGRLKGARVQELLRPAVEGCLTQIVDLAAGSERSMPADTPDASTRDRFLVAPREEFWLLPSEKAVEGYDVLIDLVKRALEDAGHEATGARAKSERFALFDLARKEKYNRMLAVGVGTVWTGAEPLPADAPPQLIVSLVDVSSKQILQTVLAQTTDGSWAGRVPDLVGVAVKKIVGLPVDTATAGISLSFLEPAVIVKDRDPDYPRAAKKKRKEGVVVIGLVVDAHGEVRDVRAVESNPLFDKAAIKAARDLRFVPARIDGEACAIHMRVRYEFEVSRGPVRPFSRF